MTSGPATDRFREAMQTAFVSTTPSPDFAFPATYAGTYRDRRLQTALRLYDAVGVKRGDRAASHAQTAQNFRLFDAPHAAVITTEEALGPYGAVDCGLFLTSLLLAFEALGIGAIPQAALAAYPNAIRDHFDLPTSRLVVAAVSFGLEDPNHPANAFRTDRADARSFTTHIG